MSKNERKSIVHYIQEIEAETPNPSDVWKGTPLEKLQTRVIRQKGMIFEKGMVAYLTDQGFSDISRKTGNSADFIVNNKFIEFKTGLISVQTGKFTFNQFRDDEYDILVCLGINPNMDEYLWVIPKEEVIHRWKETGDIRYQHGTTSKPNTGIFQVDPTDPPEWLRKYGGDVKDGLRVLSDLVGQ